MAVEVGGFAGIVQTEHHFDLGVGEGSRGLVKADDFEVLAAVSLHDLNHLLIGDGQILYLRRRLDREAEVLDEQVRLLSKELRTTTQRVNLFEKVKIPETKANIKKITVYLGDEQVAAVVRSKISKKKLQAKIDEEQEAGK